MSEECAERVACSNCGASILRSTFDRCDGKCVPCFRGRKPKSKFWIVRFFRAISDFFADPEFVEHIPSVRSEDLDHFDHPEFGRVVERTIVREFPGFVMFSQGIAVRWEGEEVTDDVRREMDQWEATGAFHFIRNRGLMTERLRGIGVYPVRFDKGLANEETLSVYQESAFRGYLLDETHICQQVVDAVWRYYRQYAEDHDYQFGSEEFQLRLLSGPEDLAELVSFHGLHLPRCHSLGSSPLCFALEAEWDTEHGFSAIYHRDQVIEVGAADDGYDMQLAPAERLGVWMNESENAAQARYIEGFDVADSLY